MSPIDPRDVQAIGWTLVHFVWQGTALAALLAALDLLLRHAPAPVRYRLASATLGLMLLLPLATFGILRTSTGRGPKSAESSATQRQSVAPPSLTSVASANNREAIPARASGEGVRGRVEALLPVFVALWSAGVLLLSFRTLGGFVLVQRLKRSGLRTPSPALVEMVARLKEALDVSAAVRVCESALVQVPTVVGWLRPVVLVPMSAVTGLDAPADRADPGPRARARSAQRLPREPAAGGGGDAAFLPSGSVVDVAPHACRARALLRRPGGGRVRQPRSLRPRPGRSWTTGCAALRAVPPE